MCDAYIILCHQAPWQVNALADYLSGQGHEVFIHVDAASDIAEKIRGGERVHLVPRRVRIEWADWSMVEATLAAIEAMPENGRGYRYVHLLSGQCLPAMPAAQLESELEAAAQKQLQFIQCQPLPRHDIWGENGGMHRVCTWYPRWMVSKYSPWHRWFWPYTNKWKRLHVRRPGYYLFAPFYGGAQWWSLTGDCVAAIAAYARAHRLFCGFFRHAFCSDELFFQTCLARTGYIAKRVEDHRRFLKWPFKSAPSPMDFGPEHWEEVRQSGAFFARKFTMQPGETEVYLQQLEKSLQKSNK